MQAKQGTIQKNLEVIGNIKRKKILNIIKRKLIGSESLQNSEDFCNIKLKGEEKNFGNEVYLNKYIL